MAQKRSRDDTTVDDSTPTKKQLLDNKSALNAIRLPSEAHLPASDNEDFRIITGTYERILYGINAYWEKENGSTKIRMQPVFIVPAHTGCIRTVAIGGQFLASGSTDEIIRLYDVKKRKEYGSLGGQHSGDLTDIQFFGRYMLSASDDKTICIWRKKDWEYLKTLKGHKGRVNSLAIHPSGKIALSVSADKSAIVWNLMTARKASQNKLGQEGLCVRWNKSGDHYAIMFDRQINIYNVTDAEVAVSISQRSRFLCMQYYTSKAGKEYLITGSEDRVARIWDVSTGESVVELKGHKLRVKALSVIESKPEGSDQDVGVLVTVSSDGMIKCWDIEAALAGQDDPLFGEYDTKSRATCCTTHLGFKTVASSSSSSTKNSNNNVTIAEEKEEEQT
ncbi:hypothetical protein LRAMOSA04493 [Lichtheimia ramosa]|uniref:Uncharacterized protein n=1 Tax=Lichtheimia ramosa TaxID=688394 RepID=A0A077WZ37_9FUNG|nr:hypothetical protein LRAMOSA04493 [Lichtheimia ramosa]